VEATIYITRSDQAFLCLGGGTEDANLRLRASRGPEDRHVRYVDMPVEQGFVLQVARTGKAMIQAEGGEDPFLADASREPIGPVAAVPIRWQAKTSGVLVAARRPGEFPFGEGDLEWLGELAEYAAIAIRNADTLQHCKEQAQAREREADRAALVRKELDDLAALLQAGAETAGELANRLSLDPSAPREPAALDGTPDRSGLPTEPTRPS
jgi:GAF domain-containing protein